MIEPTGTVAEEIRVLMRGDEEAAREYLKESFLIQAVNSLFQARRAAGLTQAQLAERLHTRQSSIARLERDLSGGFTLRRFVEVALACGVAPFDVTFAPTDELIQFVSGDPEASRTPITFSAWTASQTPVSLVLAPQLGANTSVGASAAATVAQTPIVQSANGVLQPDLWNSGVRTIVVGESRAA